MKLAVCFVAVMALCQATVAQAQTMGDRAPVVVTNRYLSASSPYIAPSTGRSGSVATTYRYAQSPLPSQPISPLPQTTLQPAPITSTTVYYDGGTFNPCACPPSPTVSYRPAGIVPAGYAPYTAFRPVVSVTPMPASYYVGQGILGQPKLYVPGQPIRNVLRYLTP